MSAVVRHMKRYVVQWENLGAWEDESSFRWAWMAKRRARSRTRWMPYEYRVLDTGGSR